ncbi:MAG: protein-L-isoaspartate O-methyltransferase [Xylophilus ampelinus]
MNMPLNTTLEHPTAVDHARYNMIEQQIRPWDVLDGEILDLLSVMRREQFVPEAYVSLAFADIEIPLPGGQSMFAPRVEARALQDLQVRPHERVLEIGAGSGYMAALLARRAQHVLTLEIDPELARLAQRNLERAGVANAQVRTADGAVGVHSDEGFDVIMLSGSVAEVPQSLLDQLRPGGRLFAVVGDEPVMRAQFVTRQAAGQGFQFRQPWDVVVPRLRNFPEHAAFSF